MLIVKIMSIKRNNENEKKNQINNCKKRRFMDLILFQQKPVCHQLDKI